MFSIVIPLFNESKNIKKLTDEIFLSLDQYYKDFEIVFVNDYSIDETLKMISEIKNKHNKINIINNKKNLGQSFSIINGIESAHNDVIVTLDGDGQNNPKDIPKLLKIFFANEDIKLVGGIRVKRKDSFIKNISSKIANFVRKKILNDNCNDTGCSLKVFDKSIFLKFPKFDGLHRFLPALFVGFGHKAVFVEVDHRVRVHGASNYGTLKRLINGIFDMIKVYNIIKNHNI